MSASCTPQRRWRQARRSTGSRSRTGRRARTYVGFRGRRTPEAQTYGSWPDGLADLGSDHHGVGWRRPQGRWTGISALTDIDAGSRHPASSAWDGGLVGRRGRRLDAVLVSPGRMGRPTRPRRLSRPACSTTPPKQARSATAFHSRFLHTPGRTRCVLGIGAPRCRQADRIHRRVGAPYPTRPSVAARTTAASTPSTSPAIRRPLMTVTYILILRRARLRARIRSAAAARTTTPMLSYTPRRSTTAPRRLLPTSRSAPRTPGASIAAPLSVQQGQNDVPSTVAVTLLNGAASVATSVDQPGHGVTASTAASATATATVNVSATAAADPGDYTVTLHGVAGAASHNVTIYVHVPAPAAVGVPLLTNAYNAPST